MIQQINLYRAEFGTTAAMPNFRHLLLSCGGTAALLVLIFLWQLFQLNQLNSEIADTERDIGEIMSTMATVAVGDSGAQLQTIDQKIAQLKNRLQQLRDITALLASQPDSSVNQSGFSNQFDGLVRQHIPGISLSTMKLFDGGNSLELEGAASPPEKAPRYLAALQDDQAFKRVAFGQLHMKRDPESNEIVFHLQHHTEGDEL